MAQRRKEEKNVCDNFLSYKPIDSSEKEENISIRTWECKDYKLNAYPTDEAGNSLELSYGEYLEWLADYLYEANAPISEIQRAEFEFASGSDLDTAMAGIGVTAGQHDNINAGRPFYIFPDNFESDYDIKRTVPRDPPEVYGYEELDDEAKEEITEREFILDDYEYHLTLKAERAQFEKHWPGFIKGDEPGGLHGRLLVGEEIFDGKLEPPDAGWRVLLAAILKKTKDKDQRIHLLKKFYNGYLDEVSK